MSLRGTIWIEILLLFVTAFLAVQSLDHGFVPEARVETRSGLARGSLRTGQGPLEVRLFEAPGGMGAFRHEALFGRRSAGFLTPVRLRGGAEESVADGDGDEQSPRAFPDEANENNRGKEPLIRLGGRVFRAVGRALCTARRRLRRFSDARALRESGAAVGRALSAAALHMKFWQVDGNGRAAFLCGLRRVGRGALGVWAVSLLLGSCILPLVMGPRGGGDDGVEDSELMEGPLDFFVYMALHSWAVSHALLFLASLGVYEERGGAPGVEFEPLSGAAAASHGLPMLLTTPGFRNLQSKSEVLAATCLGLTAAMPFSVLCVFIPAMGMLSLRVAREGLLDRASALWERIFRPRRPPGTRDDRKNAGISEVIEDTIVAVADDLPALLQTMDVALGSERDGEVDDHLSGQ